MFWELIYMKPNPFSDITIMTQQQTIFRFNIACNNHNPDGTDYYTHIGSTYIHVLSICFNLFSLSGTTLDNATVQYRKDKPCKINMVSTCRAYILGKRTK